MNGPFFSASAHNAYFFSPLHDELVALLLVGARLEALRGHAPRRHRVTSTRGAALAAAERVVDRVHGHTTHVRLLAQPAAPTGFADRDVLEVEIADLADRGLARLQDLANFARRHLDRDVVAFFRHDLHRSAGAARELSAVPRLQLHVVHERALRDIAKRQRVARQDVGRLAGDDRVSHLQPQGLEHVALLAIRVGDERDARGAVRVVLDRRHRAGNVLLVPLEVDDPVQTLVTATTPPAGEFAGVVAAARALQRFGQRSVRGIDGDLVEHLHRLEPPPW